MSWMTSWHGCLSEHLERLVGRARLDRRVAGLLQQQRQRRGHGAVVVDDQDHGSLVDGRLGRASLAAYRLMTAESLQAAGSLVSQRFRGSTVVAIRLGYQPHANVRR